MHLEGEPRSSSSIQFALTTNAEACMMNRPDDGGGPTLLPACCALVWSQIGDPDRIDVTRLPLPAL
jgi:hypothetical protein